MDVPVQNGVGRVDVFLIHPLLGQADRFTEAYKWSARLNTPFDLNRVLCGVNRLNELVCRAPLVIKA